MPKHAEEELRGGRKIGMVSRDRSRESSIKHETMVSSKDRGWKTKPGGVRGVSNRIRMTLIGS